MIVQGDFYMAYMHKQSALDKINEVMSRGWEMGVSIQRIGLSYDDFTDLMSQSASHYIGAQGPQFGMSMNYVDTDFGRVEVYYDGAMPNRAGISGFDRTKNDTKLDGLKNLLK